MRRRTRARELALQFLYSQDVRDEDLRAELGTFLKDAGAGAAIRAYAEALVEGVSAHRDELDKTIRDLAANWSLERIARIDRNILRLAAFEILYGDDVPPKVAINEAIELGKRYSTAQSGAFINGILDKVQQYRTSPDPP